MTDDDDNIVELPKPKTYAEGRRADPVVRARRRARVLELRAAGLTEEEIALQCDMSISGVSRIIRAQLDKWQEDARANIEEIRAMKLYELDQLKKAIWAKALKGDLRAVREASKIVQMQARISGAEAPRKIESHQVPGLAGIDPAEIERMERAWIESRGDVDQVIDAEVVEQQQLPISTKDNLDDLGS